MEQLLTNLQSPNAALREPAEKQLNELAAQPEPFLAELVRVMLQSPDPTRRDLAAVLFRRYAFNYLDDNNSLWVKISPEVAQQIKANLLVALQNEKAERVLGRICNAVAEIMRFEQRQALASVRAAGGGRSVSVMDLPPAWPELLQFLFQCTSSPDPLLREVVWRILAALPNIFGNQQDRYETTLSQLMLTAISDTSSLRIRETASKAAVAFIKDAVPKERRQAYSPVIPALLEATVALLKDHEDTAQQILQELIELADTSAIMFKPYTATVTDVGVNIVDGNIEGGLEDATRQLALELLLVLAENKPAMMRKTPTFVARTLRSILMLMTDLEDDRSWHTSDKIEGEEEGSNALVGEQSLDRFSKAIRGKELMPVANELLSQMFQHPNWTHRHAALLAVSAMAEGCLAEMYEMLDSIVARIVGFATDPHPRVRHALCNCIGQLCYDFAPRFQRRYADQIIPCIMTMLDDMANPRVHTHAAAAVINFVTDSEDYDEDEEEAGEGDFQSPVARAFAPYSDLVLQKLINLMSHAQKRYVMEQAIDTIAAISEVAGHTFAKHYAVFMPALESILARATGPDDRLLRGKAIECITLIGVAVGADIFREDAKRIMQLLISTNPADMNADDPQLSYVLLAYGRVAGILKEEFVPYLGAIMGHVLSSADLQPDVAILNEDDPDDGHDASEGWQVVQMEDKRVCIKTSTLDEKMNGIQMILTLSKALGAHYAPYVEGSFKVLLPLIARYLDDNCRIVAGACVGPLLQSLREAKADETMIAHYWNASMEAFLAAISHEDDPEVLRGFFEGLQKAEAVARERFFVSYRQAVYTMRAPVLTDQQLLAFTNAFRKVMEDYLERSDERAKERQGNDKDDEELEQLDNEDEIDSVMLTELCDTVRAIFETHGARFLPAFVHLMPLLGRMLGPTSTEAQQKTAIIFFDDAIEFASPQSAELALQFLPAMQGALYSTSPAVRQAAAYGFGVMAQHGGDAYTRVCVDILQTLNAVIAAPKSRSDENIYATENAIAAVVKICKFQGAKFDVGRVLPALLEMLPLREEDEEAAVVYDYFCELVETSHPAILGANNSNLPQIVFILTEAIQSKIMPDQSAAYRRCFNLLRSIHTQVPPEAHAALWERVKPTTRAAMIAELGSRAQ